LHEVKVADLYRQAGQLDSAISIYRRIYAVKPLNPIVKKGLGLSLLTANELDEAMELLHYYLPVSGGIPDAEVIEAVGRKNAEMGNYGDAVILFQFLYNSADDRNKNYYGRALAIYSLLDKRYEYAIQVMGPILSEFPRDFELHFFFGSAQEMLDSTQKALDGYNRALEIYPGYEKAHHAKVICFARLEEVDSTISSVEAYTTACERSINAWSLYGTILVTIREFEKAVGPLEQAVSLSGGIDNSSTSIVFELAMSYERTGKFAAAEDLLQVVLEREPENATAANYLGYMWIERGEKIRSAKKLIVKALEIEPGNPAFLDSYGWALYRERSYEEALEPLLLALESIDDDYVIYYHLAMVYEKLNKLNEALEMFRKSNSFENPIQEEISEKIQELSQEIGDIK